MRHDSSHRIFLALFVALAVFIGSRPAVAQTSIAAGTDPVAIAINTVTNKIYVANEFSDNVTIIDGATNATRTVAVSSSSVSIPEPFGRHGKNRSSIAPGPIEVGNWCMGPRLE